VTLNGWLGRQFVGDFWHRMYDGGSSTLCDKRNRSFSAGPEIDDTFRGPERQRVGRCPKCETMFRELYPRRRRRSRA
jgi:hypothetical protein